MKSIQDLVKKLANYRNGTGDLPTYRELVILIDAIGEYKLIGYAKTEFVSMRDNLTDATFFGVSQKPDKYYDTPIYIKE